VQSSERYHVLNSKSLSPLDKKMPGQSLLKGSLIWQAVTVPSNISPNHLFAQQPQFEHHGFALSNHSIAAALVLTPQVFVVKANP